MLKININIRIFFTETTKTTEKNNQINNRMALLTRRQKIAITIHYRNSKRTTNSKLSR